MIYSIIPRELLKLIFKSLANHMAFSIDAMKTKKLAQDKIELEKELAFKHQLEASYSTLEKYTHNIRTILGTIKQGIVTIDGDM